MRYALIGNDVVENIVICGSDEIAFKIFLKHTVINITNIVCGIGWAYDGTNFTAPVIERTATELAIENIHIANSEYARATEMITALNEQIADDDYAGTTEYIVKSVLTAWTEYRKSLRGYLKLGDGNQILPVLQTV